MASPGTRVVPDDGLPGAVSRHRPAPAGRSEDSCGRDAVGAGSSGEELRQLTPPSEAQLGPASCHDPGQLVRGQTAPSLPVCQVSPPPSDHTAGGSGQDTAVGRVPLCGATLHGVLATSLVCDFRHVPPMARPVAGPNRFTSCRPGQSADLRQLWRRREAAWRTRRG